MVVHACNLPALGRMRQEDSSEFEARLHYIVRAYVKKQIKRHAKLVAPLYLGA